MEAKAGLLPPFSIPNKKLADKLTVIFIILLTTNSAFPRTGQAFEPASRGVLRLHPANPRYFTDGGGQVVYLTGSHYWWNLQDVDTQYPIRKPFDYDAYLNMLVENRHNFIRLWCWENSYSDSPTQDYWYTPMPYLRPGPGLALDGNPRYDVSRFNQAYFDRLRQRVIAAGQRNIYVSIMLFNGWSVDNKDDLHNPWPGHPFNAQNNINGIKGSRIWENSSKELHTQRDKTINDLQIAYVHKVIDTVNDLDNVLYEISNESHAGSVEWQYAMIDEIHRYEALKPKQHPVGMTSIFPQGSNTDLLDSPADWISPNGDINNPEAATGQKVVLYDTDHLCGTCGDPQWPWRSLLRGLNPILMDPYLESTDPLWPAIRRNMGYARDYANRIDLARMVPRGDLSSSGYALAATSAPAAEYLVFLPEGRNVTVDLSAAVGEFKVEWFDPETGSRVAGQSVTGGAAHLFTSPFTTNGVILFIYRRTFTWLNMVIR